MSRILLVEDDPVAQAIVSAVLESQGLEVDIVSDGFAALRMLRDQAYEMALVDYHLPEMDGYALAKLMRDISGRQETSLRLVGMTADRHGLAARREVDAVFDALLAKPFSPDELIKLLAIHLRNCTTRSTAHVAAAALLADPISSDAAAAASSFWRARGLPNVPKATILPNPTSDQVEAIQICFDIVDPESAEILLILDARGLQELIRVRLEGQSRTLPVITLDRSLASVSDAVFSVSDPDSWSSVARLVRRSV